MTTDIVGTIAYNPNDDRLLIFSIDTDTLPQDTLDPVDSIINPHTKGPYNADTDTDHGLPAPDSGQRYLLVEAIASGTPVWGPITDGFDNEVVANANDIIQYNVLSRGWEVVFNSQDELNTQYVTNITSAVQYRFSNGVWMKSYEGWYGEGDYSIVI
jgi:hypothetical protein